MATDQELYQQYLKETGQVDKTADPLYQQYLQETGQKPGAELQKPGATIDKKGDIVIDEMHPELTGVKGTMVRAVYKNFGADPVASFNYLQKQFPNLEWKLDANKEPIVKAPGETQYRKLDPSGFDWRDAPDVAYDVGAGVAQGAATGAAGIAGGLAGGGAGAIPAAMAASGVSGAALEAARQKIGNLLGIEQSVNPTDVAISGALGAATPAVLGVGTGAKALAQTAAKQGLSEAEKFALEQSQRGLLGRAYDATAGFVAPKVGSVISGIPEKTIKTAANMLPEIQAADKSSAVMTEPLAQAAESVPKILKQKTREVGSYLDELRGLIDKPAKGEAKAVAQGSIPTASLKQPFVDLVAKLETSSTGTASEVKDLAKLKDLVTSEFDGMPEMITAAQADAKSKRFKALAENFGMKYGKGPSTVSALEGSSAHDAAIASTFEQARRNAQDAIVTRLEQLNPQAAQDYAQTIDAYSQLKTLAKENQSNFKNAKSVQNFMRRAASKDVENQNLEALQQVTGYNLEDLAFKDKALEMFSKPATAVRSLQGTTSTSRTIPLAIAGGAAGYYTGQQSGGDYSPYLMSAVGAALGAKAGSPAAIRRYMEMNQAARTLPGKLPGYQAMPYTLMNMEKNK